MKLCKKTLSVVLSILIMVSCMSVCFAPIEAHAATPTNAQLNAAFNAIKNTTDLTNGDGTLLNAAEVLSQQATRAKTSVQLSAKNSTFTQQKLFRNLLIQSRMLSMQYTVFSMHLNPLLKLTFTSLLM